MTSLALTIMPAMATAVGVLQWRTFKVGRELLLPVQRKSYLRQLGAAAALSHIQLWGGMSLAVALWWLLTGPRPLPLPVLAGVLAFSAAFQVGVFGVLVWTARYRSKARAVFALMAFFIAGQVAATAAAQRRWSTSPPGQLLHEVLWIAGITAVLGALITLDAYRRWLAADFD
jgi:hypothetical protein